MPTTEGQRSSWRMGCTRAIRARHAYDGESFLSAGAAVLVEDGLIIGVESYRFEVPGDCLVTCHEGTLLPGLIDAHALATATSGAAQACGVGARKGRRGSAVRRVHPARDPGLRRPAAGGGRERRVRAAAFLPAPGPVATEFPHGTGSTRLPTPSMDPGDVVTA
jgi:hypothetical protein